MLLLIVLLSFLTIFTVIYMLLSTFVPINGPVEMRLRALDEINIGRTDIDEELSRPFMQRVMAPITGDIASALTRFAPHSIRRMVEEKMAMAGGFGGLSSNEFLVLCCFLALSLPVITAFGAKLMGVAANKVIGYSVIAAEIGLVLPLVMLTQKIAARKLSIQKNLPDVLDLLTVSVEAGLAFDGALAKLSEKMKGALVEEFSRALQEMRIGVSRRDALHALGKRCAVADLSLFTTSLVQADQLGVSIGHVLRIQSASMREKRRQRAEEKAMKAPIKMMLPLVLFIFPTIFVVLLGPAAIQLLNNFILK